MLALGFAATARGQAAQVGSILSPGPLARPHASLEGADKCSRCHEPGNRVTPARCLACHPAVAERIARKAGVHRAVKDDCVPCHSEHAGPEGDLRRLDTRTFDHAVETGFPLDGAHARLAAQCSSCHKTRSFLQASRACVSCHADPHKGSLGGDCARCHSTSTPFKAARASFEHARTRFALSGAHQDAACEKCHPGGSFGGTRFDTCAACHREPHAGKFGTACTECHTTERWATRTVDHSKTDFPLKGAHARVACTKCHSSTMTRPLRFDQCSACHANVHRESVKQDCRACHTENGFTPAAFDHAARTAFPLTYAHTGLACRRCHKSISGPEVPLPGKAVDFSGLDAKCVSCHADRHKGEYGSACNSCHTPARFGVAGFEHPRSPEFFGGQHKGVACARCHVRSAGAPARGTAPAAPETRFPTLECRGCHADVHLGQLGAACESCHAVDAPRFAAAGFSHSRTAFPLTGRHQGVPCVSCHPRDTRPFPSATGTAVRFRPTPVECRACHKDPHLGQLDPHCERCHSPETFAITRFEHRGLGLERLFSDFHGRLACASCHKRTAGQFPGGFGTAVRFKVGRTCLGCHPR